ncbi:gfo/Idh/MocA family oxidoreductase [Paenibacillus sp. 1011MAR3C5]|uniref:Gfo/Idh/MocA family protein n=1 Tax=Paenibacillus sp. 1011MAR3C5 TaxID=1675787 RepID=UPI000E6D0C94|nr:Gfo/Idh/MocA family oxidoreductase [Paenibacillus sp. 1011MAR3C5]RJE89740.1 gfo/Idh/MocA family oxidoreductase [Paenibacillus sp. 1011MAR3C5]
MKVAVLGCGGMGAIHAGIYASLANVQLTGVCDANRQLADTLAEQTGTVAYYSFDDMLANADFDAVSIALPTYLHKEYTLEAAKARKHIICEKPIALSLEDAREMMNACEENNVRLFVGHVVRFFPDYIHLKQTLDSGKLGRPAVAHASRIGAHPGSWFHDEKLSGGVIVDLMIHDLDFLRSCFGEVESIYALNAKQEELDYALVTLRFENGTIANVEANWGYPGPFHTKAEIAGSAGIVRANSLKSSSLQIVKNKASSDSTGSVVIPGSPGYRSPYELQLEHFIRSIEDGSEPIVTAADAYKALELALYARESAATGKAVYLKGGNAQ